MGSVITLANQKGGVGKTTTSVNLGACLAETGQRVLLIDLDPQGNATSGLGVEKQNIKQSIYDVLINEVPLEDVIQKTSHVGVDIAPTTIALSGAEVELTNLMARETRLKDSFGEIRQKYDFILIDCPPQLSILTINALSACDRVIIPCKTDYLSYRGLEQLEDTIDAVRNEVNRNLKVLGIIATLYEQRVKDDRDVLEFLKEKGTVIATVKKRAIAKKGIYSGMAVVEQDAKNDIALAYKKVCDIIEKEC